MIFLAPLSLIQQTKGVCGSVPTFVRFHNGAPHRDRTGASRRRNSECFAPTKLTARAEWSDELVGTTTATLARPTPLPADAIDGEPLHPSRFLKSQSKQRAAVL